ncbi:MAG: metal-dependent transcriptional regulator [Candidatus Fermentibacteria bacterium]
MTSAVNDITGSLEDYLETIYRILGRSSVARVRDIAEEMEVSPASVTPAMKRLAEKQLIRYSKRNYIDLTEKGLFVARRTMTRHNLLSRFFTEILGIDPEQAESEACSMEHFLSEDSMERLAAFFEFHAASPELQDLLNAGFTSCPEPENGNDLTKLTNLEPGCTGTIASLNAGRKLRGQLIDSGFIQGSRVTLIRPGDDDLPFIVNLDGYDQQLPTLTAESILVHPDSELTGEDDNEK